MEIIECIEIMKSTEIMGFNRLQYADYSECRDYGVKVVRDY